MKKTVVYYTDYTVPPEMDTNWSCPMRICMYMYLYF